MPSDFNRPDLQVNCLADGVLVQINLRDDNFKGVMYVKGHSNDERCRQSVNAQELERGIVDFKVLFGVCGLFHSDVSRKIHKSSLFHNFHISGRSQLRLGDTETSQISHIQIPSIQNPLCVQHWNTNH